MEYSKPCGQPIGHAPPAYIIGETCTEANLCDTCKKIRKLEIQVNHLSDLLLEVNGCLRSKPIYGVHSLIDKVQTFLNDMEEQQ